MLCKSAIDYMKLTNTMRHIVSSLYVRGYNIIYYIILELLDKISNCCVYSRGIQDCNVG